MYVWIICIWDRITCLRHSKSHVRFTYLHMHSIASQPASVYGMRMRIHIYTHQYWPLFFFFCYSVIIVVVDHFFLLFSSVVYGNVHFCVYTWYLTSRPLPFMQFALEYWAKSVQVYGYRWCTVSNASLSCVQLCCLDTWDDFIFTKRINGCNPN